MSKELKRQLESYARFQRRMVVFSLLFVAVAFVACVIKLIVDGPSVLFDGHYVSAPYIRFR